LAQARFGCLAQASQTQQASPARVFTMHCGLRTNQLTQLNHSILLWASQARPVLAGVCFSHQDVDLSAWIKEEDTLPFSCFENHLPWRIKTRVRSGWEHRGCWAKVELEGLLPQFSRIGTFAPIRDADVSKIWPFLGRSLIHLQSTAQLLKYNPSIYQSLRLDVSSHISF